jgi:hypothetical protein
MTVEADNSDDAHRPLEKSHNEFGSRSGKLPSNLAMTAARPAALSLRFGLGASVAAGAVGSVSPLIPAHLAFCANAIYPGPSFTCLPCQGSVPNPDLISHAKCFQ